MMDFKSILAICISTPLSLIILGIILPRIMRRGHASVSVGNAKVSVGKDEQPRRRATDNLDESNQALVTQITALIKESTHKCGQMDALEIITEGIEIMAPTLSAVAAEAVGRGVNGAVKKGAEALPDYERRFRALGREGLIKGGVAS
jgi:hypothetical protein